MAGKDRSREAMARFLDPLYLAQRWPLEKLPYTRAFESLFAAFTAEYGDTLDRGAFWRLMLSLRKEGLLSNHSGAAPVRKGREVKKEAKKDDIKGFF